MGGRIQVVRYRGRIQATDYETLTEILEETDKVIDRYELVSRNSPRLSGPDIDSPFTLGNGEFAFTADITGLQTFSEAYGNFPLCTMSQWGWHSFPTDLDRSKLRLKHYKTYDRNVGYASDDKGQRQLFNDLRENPHRLNLGRIGLDILKGGKRAELSELEAVQQKLELWEGLLKSDFRFLGEDVRVETCVDPEIDAVSACITSVMVSSGELSVSISFPYGSSHKNASDWESEEAHSSTIIGASPGRTIIKRVLDNDVYFVDIVSAPGIVVRQTGRHRFMLCAGEPCSAPDTASGSLSTISFTCRFTSVLPDLVPHTFYETKRRAAGYWKQFWTSGGAIQLSKSSDSRAGELERRIVLSQYLTAIQCSGSLPPAETGLSCNSWYGKFHLEMHFWHAAHFALWGRTHLLERSLGWYVEILPAARAIAASQGYRGARWPKMCGPEGYDSPSSIGVLLVWQQPHPIMYAELCYRARPDEDTLEQYREIVMETAEFMISYVHYDEKQDRYVLGPPVIPVQETHNPEDCINPTFELEYFRWGLRTANKWLVRLGESPDERYAEIEQKLARLPVRDETYIAHENCPETFLSAPYNQDHPSMLAVLGVLPGEAVDRTIMENTLNRVLQYWDFSSMWGWDFAVMAMCCARLGLTSTAVDMLLADEPKNHYAVNGHNSQADREDLPLYLPGNGGLLLAAAMMAAGWEGCGYAEGVCGYNGIDHAPGFPTDGSWVVEAEGLLRYL